MRSTHQTVKGGSTVNRLIDNLNKQKFTTNIDEQMELERKVNAEISLNKKKHMTSLEPFWQDFNPTVNNILRQKEDDQHANTGRSKGPHQRNRSKPVLHQTTTSFATTGHGNIESLARHGTNQREK